MKKTILCFVILVCLVFTDCGIASFDWDKSVDKLKDNGFTVDKNCTTKEELDEVSASLNSSIKFEGNDFTVECTKYTTLQKGDYKNTCMFIEFATEEQAKKYYDSYIKSRTEESKWKLCINNKVVLLSNSDEATELIGGTFE